MRISQLKSLTKHEFDLLLYIFNVLEPIRPPIVIDEKSILFIRHDILTWKVAQQESKLTDEGKLVFKGLMSKLNKTTAQETVENIEYEDKSQMEFPIIYNNSFDINPTQLEFTI